MTKKKAGNSKVARAAAAAAAAAVTASQQDETDKEVLLNWSGDEDEDDEDTADEVLEGLEQIDEESAGGVVWWELYCSSPLEKAGQIKKMSTAELRGLRDECLALGPGEYYVVARHKKGTFVKGSRRRIKISGYARPAAAAAPNSAFDPMALMVQMEERAERRRAEERQQRNAQIKFWAPILAPIGLEMAKGLFNRGGGEPLKDLVAALVGMKDLTGGGGKSNDVENLLKGIELARDLGPGDAKGSTWPDVIATGVTSVVRELRPLAEQLAARRTAGAPPPAAAPQLQFQPAPAAAAGPNTTVATTAPGPAAGAPAAGEVDPMMAMIEPLLRKLAGEVEDFAANNANPELCAEAVLAKIPPFLRSQVEPAQLKEWLTQANWWPLASGFHPALAPYQAYCNDVRTALLQLVEEMINPPPEEGDG